MPTDEFKPEVEKELTGNDEEPWETVYIKLYKSQLTVVEQAIDTAALRLGSGERRGYRLEMIRGLPSGSTSGERRPEGLTEFNLAPV